MSDFGAKRERWKSNLLHALALAAVAATLSLTPAVHELNRRLSDSYFRLQPEGPASPVVVVSIDDESLQKYGRWPWSRDVLAQLIRSVAAQKPKVVGIDILLSEPQSPGQDATLRAALAASAPVVLVDKVAEFPDGPRWMEPIPDFVGIAAAVGHAQAVLDSDGLCRSFPPEELSLAGPRYAFALEVVRQVSRTKVDAFFASYGLRVGSDADRVQVARPLLLPIAFRKERMTTISAADVLAGSEPKRLRDKVVLIGFGAVEIEDRITTPVSKGLPTPGVEVHAHIADAILAGRTLRSMSLFGITLLLLSVSYASVIVFRLWRGWETVPILLIAATTVYGIGLLSFQYAGRIAPIGTLGTAVVIAPLMVYGVELARVQSSIGRQMRLLQHWLAYRQSPSNAPDEDISWKLRVLTDLQQELGLRFELYRTLLEATRDLVAVFDSQDRLLFANHAFNLAWRGAASPATLHEVRHRIVESEEVPMEKIGSIYEGEGTLNRELFSIRLVPLPSTSLTPDGGTLLNMTSLHLRVERDKAREEALGFVTHELRTPLMAIQGFAELMTKMPNAKTSVQAPETILRESRRLLSLINSYLDVLRTDAGARPIKLVNVAVRKMILQVFELLSPLAQASAIELVIDCDENIFVSADEPLLTGAILNLVSNAIKYGDRGTEVKVRAAVSGTELQVSVHNGGAPIANPESIFDTFVRGSNDEHSQPGWGIGLSLVKRIVEKHGGSVTVQSDKESGTTFTITMPGAVAAMEVSAL